MGRFKQDVFDNYQEKNVDYYFQATQIIKAHEKEK
jgi:hypothetical protein